jgi:hypothetical protein
MWKYLVIVSVLFLVACKEKNNTNQTSDMITVCLDGVAYWVDGEDTYFQMMAPKIDPETLTFVRCEGK